MSSSMKTSSQTVGITGATGFVGAAITEVLRAAGFHIRVLVRNPDRLAVDRTGLEVCIGDLGDRAAVAQFVDGLDHIVHCAGLTHARDRADFYRVNVDGASALAAAFVSADPNAQGGERDQRGSGHGRRFVQISSLAARQPSVSTYADSKFQSEGAVRAAFPDGGDQGSAPAWVCLRAPALYGPRDTATLPFFKSVKSGFAPIPGGVKTRASILHVDDFARAVAVAISGAAPGVVYEVGDQNPDGHSWQEIAEACAAGQGVGVRIVPLPKMVLSGWAFVSSTAMRLAGQAPMVTPEKIDEFFYPDWAARDNLLAQATDWAPQINLAHGFKMTAQWYRGAHLL
ncbi:MAG: NAD(P)-dependent oxidoreductase [Pseudomonadota bacterium]